MDDAQHISRRRAILAMSAAAVAVASPDRAAARAQDLRRIKEIPDFSQTDPRLGLPNGGEMYCAPVAAANGLVWLAEHRGFSQLLPVQGLSLTEKVAMLARALGSSALMSTAPKGGTTFDRFLFGLERYALQVGYRPVVAYRGRWPMPARFRAGPGPVDRAWMVREFDYDRVVWASIGFYETMRGQGLRRVGGHMITMVGYGRGPNGRVDHDAVSFHDSDDRSDRVRQLHLKLQPRWRGALVDRSGRRVDDVGQMLEIVAGLSLRDDVTALIDGAASLTLAQPRRRIRQITVPQKRTN